MKNIISYSLAIIFIFTSTIFVLGLDAQTDATLEITETVVEIQEIDIESVNETASEETVQIEETEATVQIEATVQTEEIEEENIIEETQLEEESSKNGLSDLEQEQLDQMIADLNESGLGNELTNDAIADWLIYAVESVSGDDDESSSESMFEGIDLSDFISGEAEYNLTEPMILTVTSEILAALFGESFESELASFIQADWYYDLFR